MNSKIVVMVIAFCILLPGIAAVYHVEVTAKRESYDFTITLTGQAYDRRSHGYVDVSLTLTGRARGILRRAVILMVRGGELNVENYGTFSISRRCGILVKSRKYIFLHIKITPSYGGGLVVWNLRGFADQNEVSFYRKRALLPLPSPKPKLYKVHLEGTITID